MYKLSETSEQRFIEDIKKFGISTACSFDTGDIKFSTEFREMCRQNRCGSYGKNYMCPPSVGETDDLIAKVKTYRRAILFQTISNIEDSYDIEGMTAAGKVHRDNVRAVQKYLSGECEAEDYLLLGAGGCKLCKRCGILDNIPCRFPEQALSSVEAYCMDVASLTNSHGLKYINGENTVSYVALILYK